MDWDKIGSLNEDEVDFYLEKLAGKDYEFYNKLGVDNRFIFERLVSLHFEGK